MKSIFGGRAFYGAAALALATAGVHQASAGNAAPERILEGRLSISWICGDHETDAPQYGLTDPSGREVRLALSPQVRLSSEDLRSLVGERVAVRVSPRAVGIDARNGIVPVVELAPLDEPDFARKAAQLDEAAKGTKAYATLLCRFSDTASTTPKQPAYFTTLMGSSNPGLDHYYRSISNNQVNLAGSQVFGWLNLPRPKAAYRKADGSFDKDLALADAVAVAEGQVTFSKFYGINIAFNVNPFPNNVVGYGGRRYTSIQGTQRVWGVTWIGQHDQCIWAHEIGHSLTLPHSSGPYGVAYDSKWDVMSQPFLGSSASLGKVAEGSIAYHYSLLGWIPEARNVAVNPNEQADSSLDAVSQLSAGTGPQIIRIPLTADGKQFYTVEARRKVGYDAYVPAEGVVVHRVDLTRSDRVAQVVDATNNADPNDAGAIWTPGETFTDAVSKVQVTVLSQTATGFRVLVSSGMLPPTEVQAKSLARNEVALTWKDNSANETGFVVQRRAAGGVFADLASLPAGAVNFSDKTVQARTTYSYRVAVKGPNGAIARSQEATLTTTGGASGKLSVSTLVNFGSVKIKKSKTKYLLIRNLSASSAMEIGVQNVTAPYSIAASTLRLMPLTIAAGGQSKLAIAFSPTAKKSFSGVLTLTSSDPSKPTTTVRLIGKGKK